MGRGVPADRRLRGLGRSSPQCGHPDLEPATSQDPCAPHRHQNVVAVGIENEGTYSSVDPPVELWNRLREMCAYICSQYLIGPTEIYGHRDCKNTACPGDDLYGMLPRLRTEVAGVLGAKIEGSAAVKASWPLLQLGDRGPAVLAAQYLLRGAGETGLVADGQFAVPMFEAVCRFPLAHGAEDANGTLGGESWPVLARPVIRGEGGDAELAVTALAGDRRTEGLPGVVTQPVWQALLGTGGTPADLSTDPVGPPR